MSTYEGRPEDRVSGPAIGLLVTGIIDLIIAVVDLVLRIVGAGLPGAINKGDAAYKAGAAMGQVTAIIWAIILLGSAVVIILGALKMKTLQSYGLAFTASILAMIPCTSCCFPLGIGVGIWALVAMNKPEVKSAFR